MKITKTQVLEIHKCTSVFNQEQIEKWFPDAFKVNNKINKPYKTNSGILKYFISKTEAYGFNSCGKWSNYNNNYQLDDTGANMWQEATIEEWEIALIKEAKKRYLKEGAIFKSVVTNDEYVFTEIYFPQGSEYIYSNNGGVIFNNGIWAEIIKTISKEEAEKQLGLKII